MTALPSLRTGFALVSLLLVSHAAHAQMRDVATHDELSQRLKMAQQNDPIRATGPAIGKSEEDPAKPLAERDLIKSSTTLAYRGFLTLVPKRSVLHIPEGFEDRLTVPAKVKVQTFRDFLASNRGWIRTMEVSREQALGHVPFPEETANAIQTSSQIVVATYKGGPISVLPLKDPEEVPGKSDQKAVTYAK